MSKLNQAEKEGRIKSILARNVDTVIEESHLKELLLSGRKLRVKLGIDPTGDKIHIGRAVVLWKLREFQDLGHKIVLIIGDFTAQVGDASDKLEKRPFLTKEQVKKNLRNYLSQIGKIIDLKKTEVRYNSEWLKKLNFQEISVLAENFSVQQMVERRNFKERWDKQTEISLREFMYPLMQGYDSVAVKADVELGGTDQLFNLLAGRKIQSSYGQKPQDVMTTKMLTGLDGRKMSTSWGNVINIVDEPGDQYGKVMSMRDEVITEYFEFATNASEEEIGLIKKELGTKEVNPRDVKQRLAHRIVSRYHGERAANKAQEEFTKKFSKKDFSGELVELVLPSALSKGVTPVLIARESSVVESNSEARRLVEQGAVRVNDEIKKNPAEIIVLKDGDVIKVGKRHFFRVKIK